VPPPEYWGLHVYDEPDLAAPGARPVWSSEVHPFVLGVELLLGAPCHEMVDLEVLGEIARVVSGSDGLEHLLLSDGFHTIRIDVLSGSLAVRAAGLRYRLEGLAAAEQPLLTLRRFLALWRTGRFSRGLHGPEVRAARWILQLRAYDALLAGADQREIATRLLSRAAGEPRWRSQASSLRSRAQRLVRGARRMAAGGYLSLLRD
jgi:hypothetical protein